MRWPLRFESTLEANVPKFFVYRGLHYLYFWMPVWVIYLQQRRGLSLTQATLMDAVFWVVAAASEVPTGAVADAYGRKTSLAIGVGLQASALALYGLAPTLSVLMAANILWAISASFLSGAEQALLYDTLRALGREGTYARVAGRSLAIMHASWGIGSVIGAVLASWDLTIPFLATAAVDLIVLALVLSMREPPVPREGDRRPGHYLRTIHEAGRAIWASPGLRTAVLYASLIPLPKFIVTIVLLQPYAIALGIPISSVGLLVLAVRGSGIAGAVSTGWITQRLGERRWTILAALAVILSLFLLAGINSIMGLVMFGVAGFVTAAVAPLAENLILREATPHIRATVISVQSLIFTMLLAGIEPALGAVGDRHGLPAAFAALGGCLTLALLPLLAFWRIGSRGVPGMGGPSVAAAGR